MTQEQIDETICNIMVNDGPDMHIDGHEIITEFIMALLEDKGEDWQQKYYSKKENHFKNE